MGFLSTFSGTSKAASSGAALRFTIVVCIRLYLPSPLGSAARRCNVDAENLPRVVLQSKIAFYEPVLLLLLLLPLLVLLRLFSNPRAATSPVATSEQLLTVGRRSLPRKVRHRGTRRECGFS